MDLKPIKRFEIVELTIGANVPGRFYFDTQPQLRNQGDQIIKIEGVQIYTASSYSNSQTNSAVPGVPVTEIPKAVLTLYVDGEESIYQIPLAQLINIDDAANEFQQEIQRFAELNNVAWEKSYIQFSVAAAGSPYVIPCGVSYIKYVRNPAAPNSWIDASTLQPV